MRLRKKKVTEAQHWQTKSEQLAAIKGLQNEIRGATNYAPALRRLETQLADLYSKYEASQQQNEERLKALEQFRDREEELRELNH
jgi:hypothetical protein